MDRPIRLDQEVPLGAAQAADRRVLPQNSTSRTERLLIFTAIVILPLQNHFPAVAGMSILFLVFGALAAYVILSRPRSLQKTWCHPVFIAAYAFIGVSTLLEYSSPLPRYDEIFRFGQMLVGMVCVATLCRDRSALEAGLYGYIVAALWLAVYLFMTSYGVIQGMGEASTFNQASKVRAAAFADQALQANINGVAFICTQGGVTAFALALSSRSSYHRVLLLGIATFCLVASFLPMSRGAAVGGLVSVGAVLYAMEVKHGRALIFVMIFGLGMYMLVPDAVWSRMTYSTETRNGKLEGRAWIYTTALNRLPEYILAGVGAGNYNQKWGFEKGFGKSHGGVLVVYGAHNAFLQILMFWGMLGLLSFLWILWCVYRSIPLQCARDELSLALLGIIVSLGVYLFLTHGFYEKSFALGVGVLVGARQWIWPTGIVSAIEVNRGPSGA